ncbi:MULTISPECIES: tRNA (adenosine(37)-N6)-threonylcarbamoyltransferase complex ATPase subunit type 1 TsaE [Flavobacteriaceae]|uniref:tRNA (adenosine(37)-N6)-threonylcarbamoyltransferase complex ATPase subunit type 1 TsaE n=1 Tax=Flavobacteriaceae TaxID=49546 RepID=UPI00149232E8|nr:MULTISPECIES: tRNA (adenosine(37)-N6)-threonylcarbamoyltransferase complex ATPase subunit type 1 TsaE [Allomuricauda]MDC6364603.1 tRNA (adenosine(37)-N6)-threonylcarbamoyltransferase complex ATPase subunit type 1 TsaE [Muricauda sp. AC10]
MKTIFQIKDIGKVAKVIIDAVPNKTLCFYGDMGVGKTTFVKSIVKELGGVDEVNSPTFGLVNEYLGENGEILAYHFDFYRIEEEMEALDMGVEEYFYSNKWIFIEWPEKIATLLPENAVKISMHFIDENTRSIEFN